MCEECFGIFLLFGFLAIEDGHGTAGAHHGDFGRGPSVVEVGLELLAAHHDVRTAVALAQGHGHLGHGGFAVGVEQFRTVADDSVVFLACAGEEAGHVNKADDGDVEGVAEAYEACGLAAGVAIEHTGIDAGLVGHYAHALAVEAGETDDDILGIVALHFEEFAVVHHSADDLVHIVGLVGVVGNNLVEHILLAVDGVVAFGAGSAFHVVLGEVAEQTANQTGKFLFALGHEMTHTALLRVHTCAAQVFLRHVLARHGLHHLRASEEHIADAFKHHDEVGQGRRIHGAAGTGTADARDLGHHAAGFDVALEDVAETSQSVDAFLNACTTRIVQADAGCAHLHGLVHHLANLLGHRFRQRTAVDREVLSEYVHQASVDSAATGHNAITQEVLLLHAEVVAAMEFEHIHFFERAFVQQEVYALTGGSLTLCVLLFDSFFAAAEACLLAKLDELFDFLQLFTHCAIE